MRALTMFLAIFVSFCPAHATWRKAETTHFTFYSDGSEKELREDAIKLERFDHLMRSLTNAGDDGGQTKLTVFFVRDVVAVKSLLNGRKDVAGFYIPSPAGALAVVPRTTWEGQFALSSDVILQHEYAHHLMLQYFPVAYPAWYVEGFAEFIGNSEIAPDGTAKVGLQAVSRAYSLALDSPLPLDKLFTRQTGELKSSEIGNFYAQSWSLVHMLSFSQVRNGQMTTYLDKVRKGVSSLDAAQQAFGDLKILTKDLEKYATAKRIKIQNIRNPIPLPKKIEVVALDAANSTTVLHRLKLMRGTAPAEREPLAIELRKLAMQYPNSGETLTLLAEAELDAEHFDASFKAAEAALIASPVNSRALLWKALALAQPLRLARNRDEAKWKAARTLIVKANRANVEDSLPLFEFFLSYLGEGKRPPAPAIAALGKAHELVPQDTAMRFYYASALAQQKRFDEAIATISVVANAPHGGKRVDAARLLLAKFEAAKANKVQGASNESMTLEELPKESE